ncbi:MAG: AI-2E family transporter [bacterium]
MWDASRFARTRSPLAILLFIALVVVLGWFVYETKVVWEYFLVSLAIAYLLGGTVNRLESKGVPRAVAIAVIFIFIIAILAVALVLLIPQLIDQIKLFTDDFPKYLKVVQAHAEKAHRWLSGLNLPGDVPALSDQFIKSMQGASGSVLKNSANRLVGVFTQLYALVIVPLLTFYMLKDVHRFRAIFLGFFAERNRPVVEGLVEKMDTAFGGFIRSRLKLCLAVGIGSSIALAIAGLKYSLLLGIICGICEFVPYVGPIVGAVPALIVGLFFGKFTYALVAILIVQLIENVVLVPRVTGEEVGLHPLTVILAILAGGKLAGAGGMILSIPLVAGAKILIEYFLLQPETAQPPLEEPTDEGEAPEQADET